MAFNDRLNDNNDSRGVKTGNTIEFWAELSTASSWVLSVAFSCVLSALMSKRVSKDFFMQLIVEMLMNKIIINDPIIHCPRKQEGKSTR